MTTATNYNSRTANHFPALLCAALLAACAPGHRSAVDGVVVFDEEIALVRGDKIDTALWEISVDDNATFVARIDEDDADVKVTMSHAGAKDIAPAKVEVDSLMDGEGIEIAVLDAPRGSRLSVSLESAQGFDRPGKARLRIVRYGAEMAGDSRIAARVAALRAWSVANSVRVSGDDSNKDPFRDIDRALVHFESAEGDASLAAWGRATRARLNYRQFINLNESLADAERAERGFAAIGASRNSARTRMQQATVLVEIAHDKAAKNPDAEEAASRAKRTLIALSSERTLSDLERARTHNYLGVLAFHLNDLPEAGARFLAAASAFEALGNYSGRLLALSNVGAIANEEGDYRSATRYYDQVIAELDRYESTSMRAMFLYNGARVDTHVGNVDRAIERLLRAVALTRENKIRPNEARMLQGLGVAYWARGDTAQATTFFEEALRINRKIDDPSGLADSLDVVGSMARETGDIQRALSLHREVVSLAAGTDVRTYALLELALDYEAASDYPRALAAAREALALCASTPNVYRRYSAQLVLAELLLAQPRRTPGAVGEAMKFAQDSLNAAILRADTTGEIAGRRLLAKSRVARGELLEARDEYERAIALIFKYRSAINNPELRATTLAHEQQTFRGYVDLLMRDVARRGPGKLLPVSSAEADALRTLEWARAINFDQGRVSPLPAAAQVRLDELLTQMAGKRVRIAALLERPDDVTRDLEKLRLDIAHLRTEVDQVRATASPDIKTIDHSTGIDLPWPVMAAGTTQLSYALETDYAYVWVRDASGIRATMLSATPTAIARDVATLAEAVRGREPQRVDAALARLSTALLPAGVLGSESRTVEVVAEGEIAGIAFAALSSSPQDPRRLAENRSIVMIGSLFAANAPLRPRQSHSLGFVALANDTTSSGDASTAVVFPPLQSAAAEARAIGAQFRRRNPSAEIRLLLGAEGSANALEQAWKGGVDVLHFATHGLADLRQPLASFLLLPALDSAGTPTYLTAGQVQEWRGDADLVYLSACETAVGPGRFAEGLPGLQRAFLRAGARGVVATLWPVEDMQANQFASDFYKRYLGGLSAPQALSETQRTWTQPGPGIRESEMPSRRMTAWAHAYYAQ